MSATQPPPQRAGSRYQPSSPAWSSMRSRYRTFTESIAQRGGSPSSRSRTRAL
ncbi:hypothetical protein ACFQV2_32505 [Actinokineospora soli]|uniref:Uncharacterized protein n=1 Tax=Actinokineospora soli TaxID=1048753 RepID=A0ABW2TU95_9PSEU